MGGGHVENADLTAGGGAVQRGISELELRIRQVLDHRSCPQKRRILTTIWRAAVWSNPRVANQRPSSVSSMGSTCAASKSLDGGGGLSTVCVRMT